MTRVYQKAFFKNRIVPIAEATLNVASSAVLYGLSVCTVFPILIAGGSVAAFRLRDHFQRLVNSAQIIGIDSLEPTWTYEALQQAVRALAQENSVAEMAFVRVGVHADELVPGTRSRGLATTLSMFVYEATPIVPQNGARLKTSVWRRIPDYAIPSRAKVNGAYVNSVLARQDALDCGYDDCIFLDAGGHVCELSAGNIFIVRDGTLITPDAASDVLEGINRRTIFEFACHLSIPLVERRVDLTELYIADEVFTCGTSTFISAVKEIDGRTIGRSLVGPITQRIREKQERVFRGDEPSYLRYLTFLYKRAMDCGQHEEVEAIGLSATRR
jgi:branched-chain amino acid aminotransferase